ARRAPGKPLLHGKMSNGESVKEAAPYLRIHSQVIILQNLTLLSNIADAPPRGGPEGNSAGKSTRSATTCPSGRSSHPGAVADAIPGLAVSYGRHLSAPPFR